MKKISIGWIFVLLLISPIYAFQGKSSNYNMEISNIEYGANRGSSTNYNGDFSTVAQPVNDAEGTLYNSQLGFYHKVKSAFAGIIQLVRDTKQVYPIALLVVMMFIGSVYTRRGWANDKEVVTINAS